MVARRLLLALVFALGISGLFTFWLSRKFSHPKTVEAANNRYVAATQNLDPGTMLSAANLKMVDWPAGMPLDGSFKKPEDVVGRTLLFPIAGNQPIVDHDLSQAGAGVGLSAKIPDGMRAISLRSDEIVGVSGFLLPGTHVDVLVTYHPMTTNGNSQPVTEIVLQDVQVLAAGQKTQPDPDGKANTTNVVTLLVSPEDAQRVTVASAQGTVQFVLRNGSDREHVNQAPAKLGLFNPFPAAPKPASVQIAKKSSLVAVTEERKPYVVETMRGDKLSQEKF